MPAMPRSSLRTPAIPLTTVGRSHDRLRCSTIALVVLVLFAAFPAVGHGQVVAPTGGSTPTASAPTASAATLAARVLSAARGELGVAESPLGSDRGPRIRVYARSTGTVDGQAWCSMFASWVFARAGAPLGAFGTGFARVRDLRAWARARRAILPLGSVPAPGDLVARGGEHVGVVERVVTGTVTVISGNSSNRVQRTRHALPQEWRVIRVDGGVPLAPGAADPDAPMPSTGTPSTGGVSPNDPSPVGEASGGSASGGALAPRR